MKWQDIANENIKLVYYFSRNEDEQGAGMLGLVKGAKTYNPELGYKLSTYLGKCILNEINLYHYKNNKYYNEIPIDEENMFYARTESTEEIILDKENIILLRQAFKKLSKKDQDIIGHYFGLKGYKKLNQIQIASKFNISQPQVSRLISRILKILKGWMEEC